MENKPEKPKPQNCLVCQKQYKAPYARVSGHLGVCSRYCETRWKSKIDDDKHKGHL